MYRSALLTLFSCLALLAPASTAGATFGDLDPTFNGGFVQGSGLNMVGGASAVQPDGKVLFVAHLPSLSPTEYGVIYRYDTDGALDPTFDDDGYQYLLVPNAEVNFTSVEVQPDGKIAIGGQYKNSPGAEWQTLAMRLLADGAFDSPGFNGGYGVVGNKDTSEGMTTIPDGSGDHDIVTVGHRFDGSFDRPVIYRFHAGLTDLDFDADSNALRSLYPGQTFKLRAVDSQPDGKLVVAAEVGTSQLVARLNSDGTLDTSFNTSGYRLVSPPSGESSIMPSAVSVLADGRIAVAGTVTGSSPYRGYVNVLSSNGQLDTAFNAGAAALIDLGASSGYSTVSAVSPYANGRLVVAGEAKPGFGDAEDTFVAIFDRDGSQSQALPDGYKLYDFSSGSGSDGALSVNVLANGQILTSGWLLDGIFGARLLADQAPTVSITAPAQGAAINAASVPVTFTTSDDSANQLDCNPASGSSVGLLPGANTITVECTDGSGNVGSASVSVTRTLPGAVLAITSPAKKSIKAKKLKSLAGTLSGDVIGSSVTLTLQRIDKKLLKKKKRCLWIKNSKGQTKKVRARKGRCSAGVKLKARLSGTNFSFKLKKSLARGSYKLTADSPGANTISRSFKVK